MSIPVLLAVDDDPGVLAALARDLRDHYDPDETDEARRLEVMSVGSGAAALEIIEGLKRQRRHVALVLSDQRMAGMNGVQLLTKVREVAPEALRVLLTAYADTDAAIRAINDARLDFFLQKPWDPPEQLLYSSLDDLLTTWHAEHSCDEPLLVFGDRWSPRSYALREFLARHRTPYRFHDTATEEGRAALKTQVGDEMPELPIVVTPDGEQVEQPEPADLARVLDLHTKAEMETYDLVVVGAGPAGLTASVYGASEGLKTLMIDREAPGGQAGLSARIENYLGFPSGLSGLDLATRAVAQARKFGVEIISPQEVKELRVEDGYKVVTFADDRSVTARALVIATGVQWRVLDVPGLDRFTGAGVYYGASMAEARTCRDETVYLVGGANSAGQAALNFANFARKVVMLVRGHSLAASMSDYLIREIEKRAHIDVQTDTCVAGADGKDRLQCLKLQRTSNGEQWTVEATSLYVMIGAEPQTGWLGAVDARDDRGFILTGPDLRRTDTGTGIEGWPLSRDPWLLETCVPGAFAAGDVRHSSVKRVASSVGEGAVAIQFVHQYLSQV